MARRIGYFFLCVGLIVVSVFAASFQAGQPSYLFCLIGLSSTILGAYLMFRYRRKPDPADRFRMINKMRNREKKSD